MKKPNETILKLYALEWINEMKIDYKQVGVDTFDTFCVLGDGKKQVKGRWDTYKQYLDVGVSYAYIAKLKPGYEKQVEDWKKFKKENSSDLAEFERLKAKLGS